MNKAGLVSLGAVYIYIYISNLLKKIKIDNKINRKIIAKPKRI